MTYKVPIGGYYQIKSEIVTYKSTGIFEEVKNPKKRWWKFWVPKTILKEKLERVILLDGSEVKYLKENDYVDVHKIILRFGDGSNG